MFGRTGISGDRTAAQTLSRQELAVLRLLSSTLSQREIGSALYISINTVKTHTRRLYRKLGVSGRHEAVVAARHLGLL